MTQKNPVIVVAALLTSLCGLLVSAQQPGPADTVPHTFLLDGKALVHLRQHGDAAVLREVQREADRAMKDAPVSVMDKQQTPPSGDKHDYMSLAPYFWPNPDTKDHLPYLRRDGQHNPEASAVEDHANLFRMEENVWRLALAYFFTHNEEYAQHAAAQLRVWFLNPATRMTPNLRFAQAVLGVNEGRGTGILDARGLADVIDAIALMDGSSAWMKADDNAMHSWFDAYFVWLTTSANGRAEAAAKNNHGSWYDVQASAIALYLGKTEFAKELAELAQTRRIALQIQADGQQPLEESRTKSFGYCVFNLDALTRLATLARAVNVELWSYRAPNGGSIRQGLTYLVPFALKEKTWIHDNITGMDGSSLRNPLLAAAIAYRDDTLESVAGKMSTKNDLRGLLLERQFAATVKGTP